MVDRLLRIVHFVEAELEIDDVSVDLNIFEVSNDESHGALPIIHKAARVCLCERLFVAVDQYRFRHPDVFIEQLPTSGPNTKHDLAFEIIKAMEIGRKLRAIECQARSVYFNLGRWTKPLDSPSHLPRDLAGQAENETHRLVSEVSG